LGLSGADPDSAGAFDGMTCGAFKMQAFAGNEQRRRISDFLEEQKRSPAVTVASLRDRAQALREAWGLGTMSAEQPATYYAFDSHYRKGDGANAQQHAWSNWLVPGRLMLGQYPHCQPAIPGPTAADARAHLARLSQAKIDGFVCLQAEVPPQDEPGSWPGDGVFLLDASDRRSWPEPFLRYAVDAADAARRANNIPPKLYHFGIPDLEVRDCTAGIHARRSIVLARPELTVAARQHYIVAPALLPPMVSASRCGAWRVETVKLNRFWHQSGTPHPAAGPRPYPQQEPLNIGKPLRTSLTLN
jgi:hypothetical protein